MGFTDPLGLRGGCGPGRKPVPNPNDSTGNSELCVLDPIEDPNKKICGTAECAADILPTPPPVSRKAECNIVCNVKPQVICTGIGLLGGGVVGAGSCMVVKATVCALVCDDDPKQCE